MSAQLNQALSDLDKLMSDLKKHMSQIPVRREGFRALHNKAAKSTATLSVEMKHAAPRLNG